MEINDYLTKDFSYILVGCDSGKKRDAMSEFWHLLVKYCDISSLEVFELPIRGLFLTAIQTNTLKIKQQIEKIIAEEQFELLYCKKATLIDSLIPTDTKRILTELAPLMLDIPDEAKWRISINRRHTKIKRRNLISKVASLPEAPKGKVDLEDPEWIISIEIFGKWTGIGVFNTINEFPLVKTDED